MAIRFGTRTNWRQRNDVYVNMWAEAAVHGVRGRETRQGLLDVDRAILKGAISGDEECMEQVWIFYYDYLWGWFDRKLRQMDIPEDYYHPDDFVSETMTRAVRSIKGFRVGGEPFGAWLTKIAKNYFIDWIRKDEPNRFVRLSEYELSEGDDKRSGDQLASSIDMELCRRNLMEDELVSRIDAREELEQPLLCLARYYPDSAEIIYLMHFRYLKYQEVCELYPGVSEGAMRVRYHRAIGRLRAYCTRQRQGRPFVGFVGKEDTKRVRKLPSRVS